MKSIIAIFLCVSLILSSSFTYAEVIPAMPSHSSLENIQIPENLGKITESFAGSSDKTIIYIQDAHDSLEAQENIAKLIRYFVETKGVKTVYEEGYEGPVPTDDYFGFIQDPAIKEKVSYFLMDKLRLGGAEYAHINRKKNFKLIGADHLQLYLENIEWYRRSAQNGKRTNEDLTLLQKQIDNLTSQYFPKEFKEWLKWKQRFDCHEASLLDYIDYLMTAQKKRSREDILDFPNLARLKTSPREVIPQALFQEIQMLEKSFAEGFLSDERNRKIFDYHQKLILVSRLSQIQLTPEEYRAIKSVLNEIETQKIADFIAGVTHKSILLSKYWERAIQDAIRFYEIANQRDETVAEKLKEFLTSKNEKIAILVFGGFHQPNIKSFLKAKNVSYAVVSPYISQPSPRHQTYYKELMGKRHHPFEMALNNLAKAVRPQSIVTLPGGQSEVRAVYETILQTSSNLPLRQLDRFMVQASRSEMRQFEAVGWDEFDPFWKAVLRLEREGDEVLWKPDYPDLVRIFFENLKKDFELTLDDKQKIRKYLDQLRNSPYLMKEFKNFLSTKLYLHQRELKMREERIEIRPDKYIRLLGALFWQPNQDQSPDAEPFISNIVNGILRDRQIVEKIKLRSNRKRTTLTGREDRATAPFAKSRAYEGEKSPYFRVTRFGEAGIKETKDETTQLKIRKALEIIDEWVKPRRSIRNLEDESMKKFVKGYEEFKQRIQILVLDSPLYLLFGDLRNKVVRAIGVGREKRMFYVPRLFLSDFDLGNPKDMNMLAAFLLDRLEWSFKYGSMKETGKSNDEIRRALNAHSKESFQKDRYGLANPEDIRSRLYRLMKLSMNAETVRLMPLLIQTYQEVHQDLIELRKRYPDYDNPKVAMRESRDFLVPITDKFNKLGGYAHILGDEKLATRFFKNSSIYIELVQKNDSGELPIDLLWKLGITNAYGRNFEQLLKNLRALLKGENFLVSADLDADERELQVRYRHSRVLSSLEIYKEELDRIFDEILATLTDSSRKREILNTQREVHKLFKEFERDSRSNLDSLESGNGSVKPKSLRAASSSTRSELRAEPEQVNSGYFSELIRRSIQGRIDLEAWLEEILSHELKQNSAALADRPWNIDEDHPWKVIHYKRTLANAVIRPTDTAQIIFDILLHQPYNLLNLLINFKTQRSMQSWLSVEEQERMIAELRKYGFENGDDFAEFFISLLKNGIKTLENQLKRISSQATYDPQYPKVPENRNGRDLPFEKDLLHPNHFYDFWANQGMDYGGDQYTGDLQELRQLADPLLKEKLLERQKQLELVQASPQTVMQSKIQEMLLNLEKQVEIKEKLLKTGIELKLLFYQNFLKDNESLIRESSRNLYSAIQAAKTPPASFSPEDTEAQDDQSAAVRSEIRSQNPVLIKTIPSIALRLPDGSLTTRRDEIEKRRNDPRAQIRLLLFEIYDLEITDPSLIALLLERSENPKSGIFLATAEDIKRSQDPLSSPLLENVLPLLPELQEPENWDESILKNLPPRDKYFIGSAGLVSLRFKDEGEMKYVLVRNERFPDKFGALGGALQISQAGFEYLETLGARSEDFEDADKHELRFVITRDKVKDYLDWFRARNDRETNPMRELYEELVSERENFLTESEWLHFFRSGTVEIIRSPETPFQSVVFDWDDTIQKSAGIINEFVSQEISRLIFGLIPTEDQKQFVRDYLNDRPQKLQDIYEWAVIERRKQGSLLSENPPSWESFSARYSEKAIPAIEKAILRQKMPLIPGVKNLISILANRGLINVIASNGLQEITDYKVAASGMKGAFQAIYSPGSSELGPEKYSKDRVINKVRIDYGFDGKQMAIIGDDVLDIKAAKTTGIYAIGFAETESKALRLKEAGADAVIYGDFRSIPILLKLFFNSEERNQIFTTKLPGPHRVYSSEADSSPLLAPKYVNVIEDLVEIDDLGRGAPVVTTVKHTQNDLVTKRLRDNADSEKSGQVSFQKRRDVERGFIAALPLEEGLHDRRIVWKYEGPEPRGFAIRDDILVIAFVNQLHVIRVFDGKLIKTIKHPKFRNLHTVEFSPTDPQKVLITSTGADRIFEVNLESGEIVWEWNPWKDNRYNRSRLGIHMVEKGDAVPRGDSFEYLTLEEARRIGNAPSSFVIPAGVDLVYEVDFAELEHELGLEKWFTTTEPNWAGYDSDSGEILSTFFNTSQAVQISQSTGEIQVLFDDLKKPHAILPFKGGYIISDTNNGRILYFDKVFNLKTIYDFSKFPIDAQIDYRKSEWIQYVHPIGDGSLLAVVDSRRSRIIVLDPERGLYSQYSNDPNWSIQSVLPMDPRTLEKWTDYSRKASEGELITVVNADGRFIKAIPRNERSELEEGQYAAGVFLFLTRYENGKLEILLQKRADGKAFFPGSADATIAGFLKSNEMPLQALRRKIEDEMAGMIRVNDSTIKKLGEQVLVYETSEGERAPAYRTIYHYPIEGKDKANFERFVRDWVPSREVDSWEWRPLEDILELIGHSRNGETAFTPALRQILQDANFRNQILVNSQNTSRSELRKVVETFEKIDSLQDKYTVFMSWNDAMQLSDEQFETDIEKVALKYKQVNFVFYGADMVNKNFDGSKEKRFRLEQLQHQLGFERIQITDQKPALLLEKTKQRKIIHIWKQPKYELDATLIRKLGKVLQFRYIGNETTVIPLALFYPDDEMRQAGSLDISRFNPSVIEQIRSAFADLVIARAA